MRKLHIEPFGFRLCSCLIKKAMLIPLYYWNDLTGRTQKVLCINGKSWFKNESKNKNRLYC